MRPRRGLDQNPNVKAPTGSMMDAKGTALPNKPRPRCPECEAAMAPLYRKRPQGTTYARAGDAFYCHEDDILAKGRTDATEFID